MVSSDGASSLFTGVGVVGVAACTAALKQYLHEDKLTSATVIGGAAGLALVVAGFAKKHVPRGDGRCNIDAQAKFLDGTSSYVDAKNEDGKTVPLYCGPKAVLALPLSEFAGGSGVALQPARDKNGLVKSISPDVKTTYDFIFGQSANDDRPALGRCTRLHTFKDAMKDGRPNPKPLVVDVPGEWKTITYAELKSQARAFGSYLRGKQGIEAKQKIAIWSGNCTEWMVADISCSVYNWTSVSVYDSLGPDAASYIVADSGAQVLVVEDKCFNKVPAMLEDAVYMSNPGRDLKVVVCIGKCDEATKKAIEAKKVKVVSFEDALACKESVPDTPPCAEDVVTIMYTSGSTGMPKGVMLQHLNVVSTVSMVGLTPSFDLGSGDVHLSYLPLAHIFERQCSMAIMIKGGTINFASAGVKNLLADLSVIRPTLFVGVPKVFENIRDAVSRKMTGAKKTLFDLAKAAKVKEIETGCGYHPIWDLLVFSKTKQALGGRARFCVTGGAPISKDTLQFVMCALGPVVQGYGATETSAAASLTMSFDPVAGHVGPPLGTSAVRLVDVPDMNYYCGPREEYAGNAQAEAAFAAGKSKSGGEVWVGGPGVSVGYWDPSVSGTKAGVPSNGMKAKTDEDFFQEDGWNWFKTGDIGSWTERGTLRIVDRKKNMFKTSLGEYVPVEEVEKTYQDSAPFADMVFLPKESKVSYVALCVVVSDSIGPIMKWAKEKGVAGDEKAVVASQEFKDELFRQLEAAAKDKKLVRFHCVTKDHVHVEYLPLGYQEGWVNGVVCASGHKEQLLTATMKPRRAQLDQYFAPHFPVIYPDRPADHVLP